MIQILADPHGPAHYSFEKRFYKKFYKPSTINKKRIGIFNFEQKKEIVIERLRSIVNFHLEILLPPNSNVINWKFFFLWSELSSFSLIICAEKIYLKT